MMYYMSHGPTEDTLDTFSLSHEKKTSTMVRAEPWRSGKDVISRVFNRFLIFYFLRTAKGTFFSLNIVD